MPRKRKLERPHSSGTPAEVSPREAELRIIGGHFRGRKLQYHGDPVVRPMKHRIREAIFNLITTEVRGRHAIDMFAGTGALGLEALSRGAPSATFIEKHVPSARIVADNIAALEVEDRAELLVTSAFVWAKRDMPSVAAAARLSSPKSPSAAMPWLVFCSPPYAFYVDRLSEMLDLVGRIQDHAPPGSILVVEADERLDFGQLAADSPTDWDERAYPPAVIGVWRGGTE